MVQVQETFNAMIVRIRDMIRHAGTMPIDGLYLDEAGDIQDRLVRVDIILVQILARISHQSVGDVLDNTRAPARFNDAGRHPRPMEQQFGHMTSPGENEGGD